MAYQSIEDVSDRELHILWTNADPSTADDMVFMYAENSVINSWWDKITIIIWGPTQSLLLSDEQVLQKIHHLQDIGVNITACLTCARKTGTENFLQKEGIEVIRWGKRLTELMQFRRHLLTV